MRLYNTLSKQVEDVRPGNPPEVTAYTCGLTVYDYPHIGNWFTFIRYDLLVRTLKAAGMHPKWVLNITDVGHLVSDADEGEDKLEKGARREGKSAWDVAQFYTDYFLKGLERLNMTQPDYLPRATEHIDEQIELIKKLEEKGYSYKIDDGIYYDTSKFPAYADFARLDLDEQQAGARVEHNPQKRNSSDFALWKFSPKDHQRDMEWDSPWGKGFPGWHIECSAMVLKYLGETVDIHSGGIDHVPVHHTNEIAQSEAVTGKPLARLWMHANHILVDGKKIAKSQGNGITLEDLEAKGYGSDTLRLLVLQSHYRSQSMFSWEIMDSTKNALSDIYRWCDLRFQPEVKAADSGDDKEIDSFIDKITAHMTNDLDSPSALTEIYRLVRRTEPRRMSDESYAKLLPFIDNLFGLNIDKRQDIEQHQKELIEQREEARRENNWQEADRLRQELTKQGIELNDTEYGPVWYRK